MEHQQEVIGGVSNSVIFNDLQWPLTPVSRSRYFSKVNISKTACLRDKDAIEH